MSRFMQIVVLAGLIILLVPSVHADEVAWGLPSNGLRMGIARAKMDGPFGQPLFDVSIQNVSQADLRVPAPTSYMDRKNDRLSRLCVTPLQPEITQGGKPFGLRSTGSGGPIPAMRQDAMVLAQGQEKEFSAVPLQSSYEAFRGGAGADEAGVGFWLLPSSSTCEIAFTMENQQAFADGQPLWLGKATSGKIAVTTAPASLDGFHVEARFTLPKTDYFLGEPIYATFTATNHGSDAIQFPTGGDYTPGRHWRFSIVATDAAGHQLPLPDSGDEVTGGGLGGDSELKTGESYSEQVLLNPYCAFTEPGQYAIDCQRTLNLGHAQDQIGFPMEAMLPQLSVKTRLTVNLVRNDAMKQAYLDALPARFQQASDDYWLLRDEIFALELTSDDAALPVILKIASTPGRNSENNAHELVDLMRCYRKDKINAVPVLLKLAHSPIARVRFSALDLLSRWRAPELESDVKEMLLSQNVTESRAAILACGTQPFPACFEQLLKMGDDPDPGVRRYLGTTLGAYRDQRAVPLLDKWLHDPNSDSEIRMGAALGLGKLGHNEGIPVMIDLLQQDATRSYRGDVMMTLQQLTGQKIQAEYYEPWHAWWEAEGKRKFGSPES